MAHKKAAGAAKNLRDSQPKYRGVKIFGGQKAQAGNIIIRQNGSKYECGQNTYLAADFTIHACIDGLVHFKKKNFKRFDGRTYLKTVVEVLPEGVEKAVKIEKVAKKETVKKESASKAEKPAVEKAEKPVKKTATKKTADKEAPAKKPATKVEKVVETVENSPAEENPAE
ncbi:hypothetical protein AGMMS50249_1440 [candidate division SR1 bacterium]|nr:hypothetical protein AGMMS50249_1440 [candidate division SR1 bacterium]